MRDPEVREHGMADASPARPPERILLATDLSCRSDRALDRAVQLAQRWGAKLFVLHVIESLEGPYAAGAKSFASEKLVAERQIRTDIGRKKIAMEVMIEGGDPADAILRSAAELGCGLIVTGIARDETFGRSILGTTVEKVIRREPVSTPVLVVKTRPRKAYRSLVVPSDFAAPASHALARAVGLFPDAAITLLHAFGIPFEGLGGIVTDLDRYKASVREEAKAFLETAMLPPSTRDRVKLAIEHGSPVEVLDSHLRANGGDLVVLGTYGFSGLLNLLMGSTAARLLSILTCDVLVVKQP